MVEVSPLGSTKNNISVAFHLTNTTLLLFFAYELQADEEMARATGRDFPAR